MTAPKLRLGVAGLGRAFMLMKDTFAQDGRIALVAAADPRVEARETFAREFGSRVYDSVDALCADSAVQAIYVSSPHQFHAEHVAAATRAGKHILVEKPMALTLEACDAMVAAADSAGVHLIVGHSHSFDRPYRHARAVIDSGAVGAVRMIHALNYTDFLYRPRRPEELATAEGGGAIFSQAPHQIDVVRYLANSAVRWVRAASGNWDPARPTEGAYTALLGFASGATATICYSGYGRFDSDALMGWIGELGMRRDASQYGAARVRLRVAKTPDEEIALKNARAYGTAPASQALPADGYNHFGFVLISCERADLRPMPDGVWIYSDAEKRFDALPPPANPRGEVIDELYAAVMNGAAPLHDGRWGRATMAACLSLLRSARENREIAL